MNLRSLNATDFDVSPFFPYRWSTIVFVSQVSVHLRAVRISKDAWHSSPPFPHGKHRWAFSFYLLTGKLEPELCLLISWDFWHSAKMLCGDSNVSLAAILRTPKKAGKLSNLLIVFWPLLRELLGRDILNSIKNEPRHHWIREISTLPCSLLWHPFLLILNSGWVVVVKAASSAQNISKRSYKDFPGDPAIKTLPSNAGEVVQSLVGELRSHIQKQYGNTFNKDF